MTVTTTFNAGEIPALLRGESGPISAWTRAWDSRRVALNVAVIVLGTGIYGAAMGWWRDPMQALYVAIKFPVVILLVAVGNAMLNAMLAPLLGLNITLRESFLSVLMSFTIAATILGAFSPLLGFLVWNAPPMSPDVKSTGAYAFIKLTQVVAIAFAGIAANVRLFQLLVKLGGNRAVASRVLFAWLAGNLFLGSQLTWIARPFIGSPQLPVAFFREDAFKSNFFEDVLRTVTRLF